MVEMKYYNPISRLIMVGLLVPLAWCGFGSRTALAGVHRGGVGACNYCHVMHGDVLNPGVGSDPLLLAASPSDICLQCHAHEYGAVFGSGPLAPPPERGPGNFVFLLEDNINDGTDGWTNPISGDAAGHNINAPGNGLTADGTYQNSPGGNYPAQDMGCTSCHDPHGNTNYRFLYGPGPVPQGITFVYAAPVAEGLPFAGPAESSSHHVAYHGGVSNWCGNCHSSYLNKHNRHAGFRHPIDENLDSKIIQRYNYYNGTADPQGGNSATAYLAEVPFEDFSTAVDGTAGPSSSSLVMCLTCHRAHATSGPHSGRWDFNISTLGQDGVISGSYPIPNPYSDPNQDRLCRKCHRNSMGGGMGGGGKGG